VKRGVPVSLPAVPARRNDPETCDHNTAFVAHERGRIFSRTLK